MGTTGRVVAVAVLVGLTFAFAPAPLWADSAITPGANIFGIDPGAVGTTVAGPLTVYYDVIGLGTGLCSGSNFGHETDMSFVMRLKKGTDTFAFAPPAPLRLCYEATHDTIQKIKDFIRDTVVPFMFPGSPTAEAKLKSVTNFRQDGEPEGNTACPTTGCTAFWFAADIQLAVKE